MIEAIALAVYVLFGVLAVAGRLWLQYRWTGDAGWRGFSRRIGSVEWLGGRLLILAGLAGFLSILIAFASGGSGLRLPVPPAARLGGIAVMLAGGVVTLVAQLEMGRSWRVGTDSHERTELVTTGLFRMVRNPIFTASLAVLIGLAIAVPTLISAAAFVAALVGVEVQVRKVEEPYLLRVHGAAYLSYARRVGRFVPRCGMLRK